MKVIFLDFDGVLNGDEWLKKQGGWVRDRPSLDPVAIGRLKKIIEATDAKVVLSSYWRYLHTSENSELLQLFRQHDCNPVIIGCTPDFPVKDQFGIGRSREIQFWLNTCHEDIESYVILDDIYDMDELRDYHVVVDWHTGLTDANVQQAINILGRHDASSMH